MFDLKQRIAATIQGHAMMRAGDRVGVGVSGGSDSLALVLILNELSQLLGIRLTVLHFNHGLRGAESDGDEQFVAALAARLKLPFLSAREDVAAVAHARHWNIEDAGRRLRYGFFDSLAADGRLDRVAVAHTADDQAETVLARMARGTGPAGLAAIYPVHGHVVRPLLEVRRAEMREYLQDLGQTWREDASNYDRSRLRSRLRHEVLPLLEGGIQPAIVSHLGRLAALAREDESFWRALTHAQLDRHLERDESGFRINCGALLKPFSNQDWDSAIDFANQVQLAVTRRLVRGIIEQLRGDCRKWTADHVERVVLLASTGRSGSRLELPGIVVERNFDWLRFYPVKPVQKESTLAAEKTLCESRTEFSHLVELGNPGDSTEVAVPEIGRRFHLKVVDWHHSRRDTDTDNAALDRDLLDPPLVLRNWRPGDFFMPKGRRSSRKLKHLFRMERVAMPRRKGWPVLSSAGMLVWTRGFPIAADYATRPSTRTGVIIGEEEL